MKNNETFAKLMDSFQYRYDMRTVFDDFLTMTICALGMNPVTRKSYDEDLYMETIARYKDDNLRHQFPKLFAQLIEEMDDQTGAHSGNDVLGDYYEQNMAVKKSRAQFFTPYNVCILMAKCMINTDSAREATEPLRILDPTCGSGRILVAASREAGPNHEYYGIDIDPVCVKMTAVNLFLNGIFHAEVLWADALSPGDFRFSYRTSFLPFGIFRVTEKEKSRLWQLNKNTFPPKRPTFPVHDLKLPSESGENIGHASQLHLF